MSAAAAADREDSPTVTPSPRLSDDGDDDNVDAGGDVQLLPEPTHRGYGSLQKIYPHPTTLDLDRLRLFDGAVDIFVECVAGSRDLTRMNSQTFRSFIR